MARFVRFNPFVLSGKTPDARNGYNLLNENLAQFVDDLKYKTDSSTHTAIHIETEDGKIVQEKTYLFPLEAKLFESKVYALKNKGFIEDSDSDWSSPVISQIIKGVVEFSIDYTKLNKITKDFNYKIPDKSSLINQITESCFFSRIVIKDAMKQLRLDMESSSKTAFTTDGGLRYQFMTMAPGLKNGSEHLQSEIERFIFGFLNSDLINQERIECCRRSIKIYLDTIFVHTKTLSGHTSTLRYIFGRLKYFNLKLDRYKSRFFDKEISFLGRSISSSGISIHPDERIRILGASCPRNLSELNSFIDSVHEYNAHIDNYDFLIQPLLDLEECSLIEWTERESIAFQNLKIAIKTAKPLPFRTKHV